MSLSTDLSHPDTAVAIQQRYYRRNFGAGFVHGIFFQMSAAFVDLHTVLPAFVLLLTPSALAVGLLATIRDVGEILPQLFTAYVVAGRRQQKPYLLAVITVRWLAWAILAWLTYRFAATRPQLVLLSLVGLFSFFSLAGGVGAVVYADIFARAIPATRRGRFIGARQLAGFGLALLAGVVVGVILGDGGPPFPTNYSLIFMLSAATLAVAFTGFALIVEPERREPRSYQSWQALLSQARLLLRHNANLRTFLLSRAALGIAVGLAPFYVVHARQTLSLDAVTIGTFLAAQMAGAALSNLLWAWLADRFGNRPVILGTLLSGGLAALFALVIPTISPAAYLLVFVAVGAMLSGMKIGYNNFVLEMAPEAVRSTCVALQNTLLAPVTLIPLLIGYFVVYTTFSTVFAVELVLLGAGFLLSLRLRDPRTEATAVCAVAPSRSPTD